MKESLNDGKMEKHVNFKKLAFQGIDLIVIFRVANS